jgi:hypothetical protein
MLLAMIANADMRFPSRGAMRPSYACNFRALKSEGAGNAGCALHPRSRVQKGKKTHTSRQVQRKQSDIPCAMALRLISRSPRRSGLFDTVACEYGCQIPVGMTGLRKLDANR